MRITSVTVMFFSFETTHFTLDSAAPDKLTVTLFFDVANHSLVTSTTTKKPATVNAIACAVAQTSPSSQNSYPDNIKGEKRIRRESKIFRK